MIARLIAIFFFFIVLMSGLRAQNQMEIDIRYVGKSIEVQPGQIINSAFFFTNRGNSEKIIQGYISAPPDWKVISNTQTIDLAPSAKKLVIFSLQVPSDFPVGNYNITLSAVDPATEDTLNSLKTNFTVTEIENISMAFLEAPENVMAGETFRAKYLLQNLGNTKKKVFIETLNCDVEGSSEIEIEPGQSVQFGVNKITSAELIDARSEYYTVRALLSGKVLKSIYRQVTIFPAKGRKPDLFLRFPVEASATYLLSNREENFENATQFQISGNGPLDTDGKHKLEFLARGPNNSGLSFMGLYNQYFVSYSHKNIELFVGEKSYAFTPLTESSRFGAGVENRVKLNNGLSFGFIYVKPRYYEEIKNELAGFTRFAFNKENEIGLFYVVKNSKYTGDVARLSSFTARVSPFEKTNVEVEISRGLFQGNWDNAIQANINSHFLIFQLSGNYYYTGKNYPGYYSNSSFYSGNFSAQLSKKINVGIFAKEDFRNAELDTFFITAPYTKMVQSVLNYSITERSDLRFFWRDYERKDRLVLDKFHFKTNSLDAQFNQRFKKIDYNLLGEIGKTTNLLLPEGENQQNTFRGNANLAYRFNSKHSVRLFGGWSNINSFVSGEQRNVTAGFSLASQFGQNLRANLDIQNAYDIDDYYRNRNLMQLNIDYQFLKKHALSFRSFYTLFKTRVGNPELTMSLTYSYRFGIPVKQIVNAGDLKGRVTYDNDQPADGIVLTIQNKKAITNKDGEFWFTTLQAGIQLLMVDRTNFEMDEITNISIPAEVEIIEDRESVFNFKITRGAKLLGKFIFVEGETLFDKTEEPESGNIIVELKNEFEQFRIITDEKGYFSFPIVRPGEWNLRVFPGSVPAGYELQKSEYTLTLLPGEERNLQMDIKPKKRNIIFKSQNTVLTPVKKENEEVSVIPENFAQKQVAVNTTYYSVQVGAFLKRKANNTGYFEKVPYDFEKQVDHYYKYFIGKFTSYKEALAEKKKLEPVFKNPFVTVIKGE